jgi:hypothetical protein
MPMTEEIERLTVDRASAETVKGVAVEQACRRSVTTGWRRPCPD